VNGKAQTHSEGWELFGEYGMRGLIRRNTYELHDSNVRTMMVRVNLNQRNTESFNGFDTFIGK
jgi:hypothetical protein